jgi:tetratricopeptide (TPR) repeat protein
MKRFVLVILIASTTWSCAYFKRPSNTDQQTNANLTDHPLYRTFTDAHEALSEGKRLLDESETEAAIDALLQAVKLDPDLAEAWFHLGIAYSLAEMQMAQSGTVEEQPSNSKERVKTNSEKAFERAVEAYKKWIESNPNDDVAQYDLGRTYSKLMQDEDAEKAFRQAVKLKPDDSDYQMELGAILIKLARYREAIDPLKKAVDLDPTNERAQELLEDAEAGRQRLDYVAPKNTNSSNSLSSNSNSNSSANSNSGSNSNSRSNSNAITRPTESNSKVKRDEPKKTPPSNKPH